MAATLKRKRVSKKSKKSWRKNVDITDVDNFLEDQRLEERLGRNLNLKRDDELFAIDVSGDVAPFEIEESKKTAPKRSLRLKENSTPSCYSLLEKRSAVPDPVGCRSGVKIKEKLKKVPPGGFGKFKKPRVNRIPKVRFRPIWDEVDKTREFNGLSNWMRSETVEHTLQNAGFKKTYRAHNLKKPSPLPAIDVPHPGMSYNPSLADHRDLIRKVAETEAAIQKEEAHIERVTTKMFRKIPVEEAEKTWMTEMSVGLEESAESSTEEREEYTAVNPPVKCKKKTLKQRRKSRENRERMQKLQFQRLEKKKRADVNERLDKLQTNIAKQEDLSLKQQEKKKEREMNSIGETKVLGKTKFEEPPLDFVSPNELMGSLRQLTPSGSVLSDRFYSFQKRNVLEPTLRRNSRNAKGKRFVKPSHKMGWEPKGY